MAYEKPKLIDLSGQEQKGFGEACSVGSGNTVCTDGTGAQGICEDGSAGQR